MQMKAEKFQEELLEKEEAKEAAAREKQEEAEYQRQLRREKRI